MTTNFGEYIRSLREERRESDASFSVRQVATRVGVEPSYLSKVERGQVAPPSEATIKRLGEALSTDPDILLALAGKLSTDLKEIICKRPQLVAELIREIRNLPDHAVEAPMITLENDTLVFRFPEVHEDAVLAVNFQRTLRIPDDDTTYPLPPGIGNFPLRHVDDHAENIPASWIDHGGTVLPMYQSEAMWLCFGNGGWGGFDGSGPYPFAIKVATGKIDAVTGEPWSNGIGRSPQNYMVSPEQPWLDGYCVEKGIIRQFVAMPLGSGYSAEEQITGEAEHGGLQIIAYPMKASAYERQR